MKAGQAAKGGAAAPKTLCMDPLRITESAATVNGCGCVATPKIVGPEGCDFGRILAKSRFEILGFLDR